LTLARYAVENSTILPVPAGLILLCPWSDMTTSHGVRTGSAHTADKADVLSPLYEGYMRYATDAFVGPHSSDRNPYLSPGSADPAMYSVVSFRGFPRTHICAADSERLLDQERVRRDRMIRDLVQDMVFYEEAVDTVHRFYSSTVFEPERLIFFKNLEKWLAQ
jgi:acetyl esterase/lipase